MHLKRHSSISRSVSVILVLPQSLWWQTHLSEMSRLLSWWLIKLKYVGWDLVVYFLQTEFSNVIKMPNRQGGVLLLDHTNVSHWAILIKCERREVTVHINYKTIQYTSDYQLFIINYKSVQYTSVWLSTHTIFELPFSHWLPFIPDHLPLSATRTILLSFLSSVLFCAVLLVPSVDHWSRLSFYLYLLIYSMISTLFDLAVIKTNLIMMHAYVPCCCGSGWQCQ